MNIKPNKFLVLLLFGLVVFALYLGFNVKHSSVNTPKKVIAVTSGSNSVPVTSVNAITKDIAKNYPSASGVPVVLGCTSGSPCDALEEIKVQPVCTNEGASIVIGDGQEVGRGGGGVEVSDNSKIELAEITVPVALLSGSQYVKDSKFAIEDTKNGFQGTYPSASQMIREDEVARILPPGQAADAHALRKNAKTGNYEVHINVKTSEQDDPSNVRNKAVIEKELNSACPKVQIAEPNPDFSNKSTTRYVVPAFQPPGQVSPSRSYGGWTCKNGGNSQFPVLTGSENYVSCISLLAPFNFMISATVAIQDWIECTVGYWETDSEGKKVFQKPDPAHCKKSVLYALQIDAVFGNPYNEQPNENTNMYFDYLVQGKTPPGAAKAIAPKDLQDRLLPNQPAVDPFYVTTPCKVRVDGRGIYKVKCLWDVSAYKRNYERQKADAAPGNIDIPATFEEYWAMVDKQAALWYLSCR